MVLGVQGTYNKVFRHDTETKHGKGIVSDDMFPEGVAAELAKKGHLKPIEEKVEKKKTDPKKEE